MPFTPGKVFTAKYTGQCANGDRIHVGDHVFYDGDSVLSHTDCHHSMDPGTGGLQVTLADLDPPLDTALCGDCHCYHNGACA